MEIYKRHILYTDEYIYVCIYIYTHLYTSVFGMLLLGSYIFYPLTSKLYNNFKMHFLVMNTCCSCQWNEITAIVMTDWLVIQ